jgi:hypothetical protein
MDHRYTQKPKDLSFPKQRALTPEEAERVLKRPEQRREAPEEKLTRPGRGGLEMLFYGVILLAIVAFQFLSQMDPAILRPAGVEDAEITAVTVHNRETDEESRVDGARVARPDCADNDAWIAADVANIEYTGRTPGDIELEAVRDGDYWELRARGRGAGEARVEVRAEIGCGERS